MPSQRYSLVLPVSPNHVKICWLKEFNQVIAGRSYQLAPMKWINAWLKYIMGMLWTCSSMISCRRWFCILRRSFKTILRLKWGQKAHMLFLICLLRQVLPLIQSFRENAPWLPPCFWSIHEWIIACIYFSSSLYTLNFFFLPF